MPVHAREKNKTEKGEREAAPGGAERSAALTRVFRKGLAEQMSRHLREQRGPALWMSGSGQCKGPVAGPCRACSRSGRPVWPERRP